MMATKKLAKDPRNEIMKHLKANRRRISWLSVVTKIPYSTLYFVLIRKDRELTDEKMETINKVLGTNFKKS